MFLARATVLSAMFGIVVFGAVRLASARDGVPGAARTWITFAGIVSGLPGDPRTANMQFSFHRSSAGGGDAGVPPSLCAPTVRDVSISTTGAFSAQIPLDDPSSPCPSDMFDGRDVLVDVAVSGESVVRNSTINPVPYAHFASVAGQYGTPDCPMGYERATDAAFTGDTRLCQKRRVDGTVYDEVVRVGVGASAFWIDRYEASVWTTPEATRGVLDSPTTPFGAGTAADYPSTFPPNGQWTRTTSPLYAVSRAGVLPSRSITWFQANEACATSGKRLPTGDEWLRAARRTDDPIEANDGTRPDRQHCNTASPSGPWNTGGRAWCESAWGAEDMIGNVWEWTAEWSAAIRPNLEINTGRTDAGVAVEATSEPQGRWTGPLYQDDGTWNVTSSVFGPEGGRTADRIDNLPAVAARGGSYVDRLQAGIFALNLYNAPTRGIPNYGFRCVVPR